MAIQVAPIPNAGQALQLGMKYGPNTGIAIQRSQYLADALRQLQESGNTISTPGELGSKLLADAITSWAKGKADKQAMTAYGADSQAQTNRASAGLMGSSQNLGALLNPDATVSAPNGPPAAPPSPQAAATPLPAPQGGGGAPGWAGDAPGTASPPTPVQSAALPPAAPVQASPQDVDALTRMIAGEAGGEGAEGQAAAAHVAMNRLGKGYGGAKSLQDVIFQPHQFEAMGRPDVMAMSPQDPAYQKASQVAQGVLSGQIPDPTGGAINFLNPQLQAQDGRPQPAWAQGQGQRIGNQVFYGGSPGQSAAAPGAPASGSAPPPGAQAQPFQLASNGPTPFPASPSPGAPPGAAGGTPPVAGPPTATGGAGVPHNYVSDDEVRVALAMANNPQTHDEGVAELYKLQMRKAGAPDPSKPYWSADGQAHYAPGTDYKTLASPSPSALIQQDGQGQIHVQTVPGVQGPLAENTTLQNGHVVQIAGGQPQPLTDPAARAKWGIQPSDRNGYALDASGKLIKTTDDPFGADKQMQYTAQVTGMEPYKNYVLGRGYLSTMQQLMKQPGGFADLGLIENAGKTVNPTVAIRPNMIEQYSKEVGWPDWLQGEISSVANHGGHLTEQGRNALLNIAQANVQSHWDQVQPILAKVDHDAQRYGLSREDLLPGLVGMPAAPPPAYPDAGIPGAAGGGGAPAQPPVQGARKAPDGNWYVSDPQRPGKYLRVQP